MNAHTCSPVDRRPLATALVLTASLLLSAALPAAGAAGTGDTYAYQVVNAYNKALLGRISYQVDRVEGDRVTVRVSPGSAATGAQRTEVYTRDGNWLRHVVESHGVPVDYEFSAAYPAFVLPLEPGKRWSLRVPAVVPGTGERRSVRVDGLVVGRERVRVPAGEFDTFKVRRFVYPGDANVNDAETRIEEFDWYAPALGMAVRTERKSAWQGLACRGADCGRHGSWQVHELVEAPRR